MIRLDRTTRRQTGAFRRRRRFARWASDRIFNTAHRLEQSARWASGRQPRRWALARRLRDLSSDLFWRYE